MKLDGSAVLHGDPDKVWAVITDPAVLARTIPGCESLEQVGDDEYKMNVSVGVGAIKGTYAGEVKLADKQHPSSYVMHASGAGAPGNARAQVSITLAPAEDGATNLTYSADAVIGGPVAGVGQRMISGVAKRMAGQFFKAIDAELTGTAVPAAVAPSAAAVSSTEEAGTAGTQVAPAPEGAAQVFAGRAAAAPGGAGGDVQILALGAVGGAVLTLIGVLVGYRMGRNR